jgi:methylmalonyl-CoA mutase
VFLAALGAPAATIARVTFAKNLFEIAGITTITASSSGTGPVDPEAIAAEFAASGSTVACICSSDAVYAEHSVAVATALATAGAAGIYLAGRPKDLMQSLYDAGVDHFIYVGCDVAVTLANLLTTLEVS